MNKIGYSDKMEMLNYAKLLFQVKRYFRKVGGLFKAHFNSTSISILQNIDPELTGF